MTKTLRILPAALLLAFALPLAAQRPRTARVKPTPIKAPVSGRRTFSMLNGMEVTLVHTGVEKRAFVALELDTGEIDEPAFGPGLASLMAGMLLQGTVARPAAQIVREAASFGTSLDVTAGPVITSLSGEVATDHIARFVSLIGDVVRHPLLDTGSFERVRRNAQHALDSTRQNSGDLARQQWRAMVFPDQPFGHPYSYAATLAALQLGHVRNVYDDQFSGARAHLYISGVFADAPTEHAVRDVFADWKAGTAAARRASAPVTRRQFQMVDRPGAARSTIWVGLPVIDPSNPDFIALEVANALFGGAPASRTPTDSREREDLAHQSGPTIWPRRNASYWANVAEVSADSTGVALGGILGQIDRLRREAPGAGELARAKQAVVDRFNAMSVSRRGVVSQLSYVREHGLGDAWLTDYVRRVMTVSPEDVRRMAERSFDPARMTITVVGNRATVEPQVVRFRVAAR